MLQSLSEHEYTRTSVPTSILWAEEAGTVVVSLFNTDTAWR
jgi:hypothetical protein